MLVRLPLTLRKTFAFTLLALSVTTINAQVFTSSSFTDWDVDGVDDRVESFMGLSAATQDSDGDDIPDSLEFSALTTNAALMVDPTVDTDNEGISDFLEIYGFYVDGTTIRGLKRIIPAADWEAFKLRAPVDDIPVYKWAAKAIEASGLISEGNNSTEMLLNISDSYLAIYNKFIAKGLPETHHFITGSPNELGTIASIMAEFVSVYDPLLTLNGEPLRVYYTDPLLQSSDWDPYSDKDEVLGTFQASVPKAPANDPLISAIPDITTHLLSYTLTEIQELRETDGTTSNHTDVVRDVTTKSHSHGFSLGLELETEWGIFTTGTGKKTTAKQSNTWTLGSSHQTEDRDAFGTLQQTTDVTNLNCFAKLQLTFNIANAGSDKATAIQPKWSVTIGDSLWQTLNGSDYLGGGATLAVGDSTQATVLGQGAGDAGCLTIDQANFLAQGGAIGIGTELESAGISYLDPDSGIIKDDGNWAVYKANYEESLARINLNVFTTQNIEINKTFWVRAYANNLPNMKLSVKDVLEKAYTPVNCGYIGYSDKNLCLATQYDGYILLGDESALDFRFFNTDGQPLDYEDSYTAFEALAPSSGNPLDIYLRPRSALSIVDVSSRAPEFTHIEVISKTGSQTGSQQLVVRAAVFDYFGIDTVEFCKKTDDCYPMEAALPNQPDGANNGYYKLELDDYALQGTEYLTAVNIAGNNTQQSPQTFYLSIIGSMYERVDEHHQRLENINQWLAYFANVQKDNPSLYNEILDNDLMDNEGAATAIYEYLSDLMGDAAQACSYVNPQPLNDVASLLAQQQTCGDAIYAYEQALASSEIRIYNPYKMPLKNVLVANDHGVSNASSSGSEFSCALGDYDLITGLKLHYKTGTGQNIGAVLNYRTIERTGLTEPLFKWSSVKEKKCGHGGSSEKRWDETADEINGTTISALVDFGWSVQRGNVTKLCVAHREFDLTSASFSSQFAQQSEYQDTHPNT